MKTEAKMEAKTEAKKERKKERIVNITYKAGAEEDQSITRLDVRNILVVMVIYGIISFINLGSLKSPQTFWYAASKNQEVTIDILSNLRTDKLNLYTGSSNAGYQILGSTDGENYNEIEMISNAKVWHWYEIELKENYQSIRISALTGQEMLGEIAVFDENGKQLEIIVDSNGRCLTDEQEMVPYDVTYKDTSCYDEIFFARSAYEYIHGQEIYEYTHPPLGKLIMCVPIIFLGMNPFSYRLMGNIAGILMLLVIYVFAKKLTGKTRYAVLAILFLAVDGMHFVHTRIGTVDSFLVLFELTAIYFMYRYICSEDSTAYRGKLKNLAFSGFFLGLAMAVKWNGAYCALALAAVFFQDFSFRNQKKKKKEQWLLQRKKIIGWCFVFFGAIPVLIYLLSYLPFLIRSEGNAFIELLLLQKKMFHYHSTLPNGNLNASPFYLWPFGRTAIAYFSKEMADGCLSEVIMFGNPFLWWSGLVSMLYVIVRAAVKKEQNYIFLATTVVVLYIPYSFIIRDMYLYHYFSVVPIMLLCLVLALRDFIKAGRILNAKARSCLVTGFSFVAIACFCFLYPVYSGLELPVKVIKPMLWVLERLLP